jgi:hypothetical protein
MHFCCFGGVKRQKRGKLIRPKEREKKVRSRLWRLLVAIMDCIRRKMPASWCLSLIDHKLR